MMQVRFIVLPLSTYKSGPPKMVAVGTAERQRENGRRMWRYSTVELRLCHPLCNASPIPLISPTVSSSANHSVTLPNQRRSQLSPLSSCEILKWFVFPISRTSAGPPLTCALHPLQATPTIFDQTPSDPVQRRLLKIFIVKSP